ncbi:hypothetical protein ACEPAF_424 [Sanghuangporus sanghuang]
MSNDRAEGGLAVEISPLSFRAVDDSRMSYKGPSSPSWPRRSLDSLPIHPPLVLRRGLLDVSVVVCPLVPLTTSTFFLLGRPPSSFNTYTSRGSAGSFSTPSSTPGLRSRQVDQYIDPRKGRAKAQMTAQQQAVFRQNADLVAFMPPAWADNTKLRLNVAGILKEWKAFCEVMGLGDWKSELRSAQKGTAMDLLHLCETYNIKSSGTCWQYFRQWKQLYSKTVGRRLDLNDSDEVLKFFKAYLIPQFQLEAPTLRAKGVTDSGDLLALYKKLLSVLFFPSELLNLFNSSSTEGNLQ